MRFFPLKTAMFLVAVGVTFVAGCTEKPQAETKPTAPVSTATTATTPRTKSLPGMPPPNPAVEHVPGSIIGADGSAPGAATAKP
ncbi:MAG: hypothetical protein H7Y38_08540 [Armatimonadetes bacterium]|nr:hypothetical protein [Armatimonadota bacterium]